MRDSHKGDWECGSQCGVDGSLAFLLLWFAFVASTILASLLVLEHSSHALVLRSLFWVFALPVRLFPSVVLQVFVHCYLFSDAPPPPCVTFGLMGLPCAALSLTMLRKNSVLFLLPTKTYASLGQRFWRCSSLKDP